MFLCLHQCTSHHTCISSVCWWMKLVHHQRHLRRTDIFVLGSWFNILYCFICSNQNCTWQHLPFLYHRSFLMFIAYLIFFCSFFLFIFLLFKHQNCRLELLFKCLCGLAPVYLADYCKRRLSILVDPICNQQICVSCLFHVQTSYGDRSFAASGPSTWNSLPAALWSTDVSIETFRTQLKTVLFNCYM